LDIGKKKASIKMLAGDNVYGQEESTSKEVESTNKYDNINILESRLNSSDAN
jgi:hypothetical protein